MKTSSARIGFLQHVRGCEPRFGERAFSHAGPAAWNSLSPDIRAAASPAMHVQETTQNALFNIAFSTLVFSLPTDI